MRGAWHRTPTLFWGHSAWHGRPFFSDWCCSVPTPVVCPSFPPAAKLQLPQSDRSPSLFMGVSLAQLIVGSPLLPRVVLGGVSVAFLPWALLWLTWSPTAPDEAQLMRCSSATNRNTPSCKPILPVCYVPIELIGRIDVDDAFAMNLRAEIVGMLILDMASLADPAVVAEVSELHRKGVRVRTVSLFAEELLGKIPLADLERMSLLFDIGELHRATYPGRSA